jgi:hypothetical protein
MVVNKVLSKEMHVPPLKIGETATFRLLNARARDYSRDEPTCPEVWQISDKQTVHDPYTGEPIIIGAVRGMKQVLDSGKPRYNSDGSPMMEYETEKLQFIKGFLSLNYEKNLLYQYMMRRNDNLTNKFRKRSSPVRFELVQEKKDIMTQLQIEDWAYKAQKLVRDGSLLNMKTLRAKLNQSPDTAFHVKSAENDLEGMKLELIRLAKIFPKQLIYASGDKQAQLSVIIYEAQNYLILNYEDNVWYISEKGKMTAIHTVDGEKTKMDSLIDFFMTEEGSAIYVNVKNELGKILKATKGADNG